MLHGGWDDLIPQRGINNIYIKLESDSITRGEKVKSEGMRNSKDVGYNHRAESDFQALC